MQLQVKAQCCHQSPAHSGTSSGSYTTALPLEQNILELFPFPPGQNANISQLISLQKSERSHDPEGCDTQSSLNDVVTGRA